MFKGILEEFEMEINKILISHSNEWKATIKGIELCNSVLNDLKEKIDQEDFETVEDEIAFFKEVKPAVMSYLIYFTEVRSCEIRKPKAGINFQVRFLEKELKKVKISVSSSEETPCDPMDLFKDCIN